MCGLLSSLRNIAKLFGAPDLKFAHVFWGKVATKKNNEIGLFLPKRIGLAAVNGIFCVSSSHS